MEESLNGGPDHGLPLQYIMESLPEAFHIIDAEGVILYANPKCLELYEVRPEDIGKQSFFSYWAEENKRVHWFDNVMSGGRSDGFEMRLKNPSGKEIWTVASSITIQYQGQTCILSTVSDITEKKRLEADLKRNEEKYSLLTEFTADVIWVYNLRSGKFTYLSPSYFELTGFTVEEGLSNKLSTHVMQESYAATREFLEKSQNDFLEDPSAQKNCLMEVCLQCKDGNGIWVEISIKNRYNKDGEIETVGVSRNIEERKQAENDIRYLSYHDQLTGLFNRRFYEEELGKMKFQKNLPFALILCDINVLKLTNDAFGHMTGDDLLKRFADVLAGELRSGDVAARIGGDEFVLLLSKTDRTGAEKLAACIREGIERSNAENPDSPILSVSFGWAVKDNADERFEAIFLQAEERMYSQKLREGDARKKEMVQLVLQKLFARERWELVHSENVGRLSMAIGAAMGLEIAALEQLWVLGRLHDIGKIGISEKILNKHEALSQEEWMEIRRHPEIGYQILRSVDKYAPIAEAVLSHHEWYDGSGYPRKLKGQEILLGARIVAVAEAYDKMVSGDSFSKPVSRAVAASELLAGSGTQFDPEIVELFLSEVIE